MSEKIYIYVGKNTYDVTEFIKYHPGGSQCIINNNGKDCTIDYNWHSKKGKDLWKKYLVKNVKNANNANNASVCVKDGNKVQNDISSKVSNDKKTSNNISDGISRKDEHDNIKN